MKVGALQTPSPSRQIEICLHVDEHRFLWLPTVKHVLNVKTQGINGDCQFLLFWRTDFVHTPPQADNRMRGVRCAGLSIMSLLVLPGAVSGSQI